jgi:sugar/nucleoside kinase (ribokinase family)
MDKSTRDLKATRTKRESYTPRRTKQTPPSAFGTGFVTLDVILKDGSPQDAVVATGGTCGNVLAILSYLGWDAFPIMRLGNDAASQIIREDLAGWGVSLDFATLQPSAGTPIIVETIRKNRRGEPVHRFSFTCPKCRAWFPSFRPITIEAAHEVVNAVEVAVPSASPPRVFFFDRVSRGALVLAQMFAAMGALIVFEPSGIGDPKLFAEAIALSHVLKYSRERIPELASRRVGARMLLLEIETCGAEGLRYRSPRFTSADWRVLNAVQAPWLTDTAGAGDWCTAGLLVRLAANGVAGLEAARPAEVDEALRFGQAAAAIACGYEGARGAMYVLPRVAFERQATLLLDGKWSPGRQSTTRVRLLSTRFTPGRGAICPSCSAPLARQHPNESGRRL